MLLRAGRNRNDEEVTDSTEKYRCVESAGITQVSTLLRGVTLEQKKHMPNRKIGR